MPPSYHYSSPKSHTQAKNGREFFCAHYELQQGLFGVYLFLKDKRFWVHRTCWDTLGGFQRRQLSAWPYLLSSPWGNGKATSPEGNLKQESPNPERFGILNLNHMLLFTCNSSTPTHTNCAEMLSFLGNNPSLFATGKSLLDAFTQQAEPGSLELGTWQTAQSTWHCLICPCSMAALWLARKINICSFHLSQYDWECEIFAVRFTMVAQFSFHQKRRADAWIIYSHHKLNSWSELFNTISSLLHN